jgi:8-oxo-dGTP pyrophosphatase MutT (NUDIX family)
VTEQSARARQTAKHKAAHKYRVLKHEEIFRGSIFSLYSDDVAMPGGGSARRDYTRHRGAVAVVALDADGTVVLIRQYRHPLRGASFELPAGLLDVDGEDPIAAAQRELAEEVDLAAEHWEPLVAVHTSPGYSDELVRVFLARGLTPVPPDERHQREDEEAELEVSRVDLDEAVAMVLRGEITNAAAAVGLLAAARRRPTSPSR